MNPINERFVNRLIHGDALDVLEEIDSNSIDLVLTDPPYFLDKLDNRWDSERVASTKYLQVVKSLPAGMKFDREQGKRFYKWYLQVSSKVMRILKPGGFFFSFSSPRLYHRMVSAIDDAGFLIRDCLIWCYTQNQPKAMSLDHFIDKSSEDNEQKERLKKELSGWKTPQMKSCFEPIVMAQKQQEGTFLENFKRYKVGLINTGAKVGNNMFPSNVITTDEITPEIDRFFLIPKPNKDEKGYNNNHRTVKPLSLCEHLITLVTFSEESIVLDPFCGSGTTLLAAKRLGRKYIGIDINQNYLDIARFRIDKTGVLKNNTAYIKEKVCLF